MLNIFLLLILLLGTIIFYYVTTFMISEIPEPPLNNLDNSILTEFYTNTPKNNDTGTGISGIAESTKENAKTMLETPPIKPNFKVSGGGGGATVISMRSRVDMANNDHI